MQIEIGSNFWDYSLMCSRQEKFWWENDVYSKVYLKSGRNAFKAICDKTCKNIENKKVLFPAYHCETESDPWYEAGWAVAYYPVEKDFTVDCNKLREVVKIINPSVIVIQSYFGFEALNDECDKFLESLKCKGIVVIEDITQSLLSNTKHAYADYYVASFRKFFAIPDGGILISKSKVNLEEIKQPDLKLTMSAVQAYSLKKEYFETRKKDVKDKFREAYVDLNNLVSINDGLYAMSDFSRKILNSINVNNIRNKRRSNFELLVKGLREIKYIEVTKSNLDASTVPLFLPVLIQSGKDRGSLQAFLAKHDIYCPIIWQISPHIKNCPIETEEVYSRILCFPIDQRYESDDMQRIIETVKEWGR